MTNASGANSSAKPNIVILDGYTTNPGDLSWDPIEALGTLTVYDHAMSGELEERVSDAEIILSNKVVWDASALDKAPKCRMIQLLSTGYNLVDLSVAKERGITVCNVPAYSTPDVAQHAIALILETTNHISPYAESVRLGNWVTSKEFTYYIDPLTELEGKTLGIYGMGSIGRTVAHVAEAFGMKVLFVNPHPRPEYETANCKQVELDEMLANSDIVSLHCPLAPDTKGMVNKEFISKMKDGARLINTARGGLICSQDIADALESGKLYWYAADVAEEEPMSKDDPLRTCINTTITPHVAWATVEARGRLIEGAAANIAAFLNGKPQNVVD